MQLNQNGRHADEEYVENHPNPYAEVIEQRRPPELARYELNTDPYANILPRADRMVTETGGHSEDDSDVPARGRSPWMVAISILLIVLLVLPITFEVLDRLFR